MLKILLLEDSDTSASILTNILENLQCKVIYVFKSGDEFLSQLNQLQEIDLLIADINLEGSLNGVQTVSKMRETHTIPFMYITSYDDPVILQTAMKTKPYGFITKPINKLNLQNQLELFKINTNTTQETQKLIESLETNVKELEKNNYLLTMSVNELTTTNQHLISATWRERELKNQLEINQKLIKGQNKKIFESINYSKNIQLAMLPDEAHFKNEFSDSILNYVPKDVVSGDFPWYRRIDECQYFAAVDCTGHGVPGAMLAIIANVILDDICYDSHLEPNKILDTLHTRMVEILNQRSANHNVNDGLDIALCRYCNKTNELMFAGAHRPLFLLKQSGDLIEIKGNKQPIGGVQYKKVHTNFTIHKLQVNKGDRIFVFSDGFQDQFGGPNGLKYGLKKIRSIITETVNQPITTTNLQLIESWNSWKGTHNQVDDVLVIGIEL